MSIISSNPEEKRWPSLRATFLLQWGTEFRTPEHQNNCKTGQIV
jgi:hypothetical protein